MSHKPQIPKKIEKRLRLTTLRPDLEPMARELVELACAGSRELWGELTHDRLKDDDRFRRRFHELAHAGMFSAQEAMTARVAAGKFLDASEELLIRAVSDTMAWGMLGGQLCYARQIYKFQNQPSLSHSNFSSVLHVCHELREKHPGCMPLISDLTSFVQVGDIINVSAERHTSIIEVKEGEHNKRVLDLAMAYEGSGCENARELIEKTESQKTVKQMGRILRQKARMAHITEVMSKGSATDPDTGTLIRIPEPFFPIKSWDEALATLTEQAMEKNWAYDVRGPIFMGAYAGDTAPRGHLLFLMALGLDGDLEQDYHIIRLMDCMRAPLAPPVFSRTLAEEVKMDLLFGRMNVCIAVSLPRLIQACERTGMDVRYATRKELGRAKTQGANPVIHRGKGLMFSLGDREMMLLEGVIFRALFHGQQPDSVLQHYLENTDLDPQGTDVP